MAVEHRAAALVLTSPLAAGVSVVCTGTYMLTTEDVDNLMRASTVTVDARDRYDYNVSVSVDDRVVLEQVREIHLISVQIE